MGLSLVRCPFCDRRYNVTGIPPGTKVLCTSCRTVLTVPGNRFVAPPSFWQRFVPRSGAAQAASALLSGLVLAAVSFVTLKEAQAPPVAATPPAATPPAAPKATPIDSASPLLRISPGAREFLLKFQSDPRFEIHVGRKFDPFVLVIEKPPDANPRRITNEFEILLPKLERTFMREFGDPLKLEPVGASELPIVVYTRRESYDAWWESVYRKPPIKVIEGVFSYLERCVSLYYDVERETATPGRIREVVLHEAIHQLVDHYARRRIGDSDRRGVWWFQEGLGTYFEGYTSAGNDLALTLGGSTSRLPLLKELATTRMEEYQDVRIQSLVHWDVEAIWADWLAQGTERDRAHQFRKLECAYAVSWGLVHFLCHAEEGKYRPLFVDYFKSELDGKGGWDELNRLLSLHHTGLSLQDLEKRFIEYIKGL